MVGIRMRFNDHVDAPIQEADDGRQPAQYGAISAAIDEHFDAGRPFYQDRIPLPHVKE